MAANNVHLPDDLLAQAEQFAESQGRTADELAAEAVRRYLAHEKLDELSRYGHRKARELGIEDLSAEERDEFVERAVREVREQGHG
jgi:hypothetical protein